MTREQSPDRTAREGGTARPAEVAPPAAAPARRSAAGRAGSHLSSESRGITREVRHGTVGSTTDLFDAVAGLRPDTARHESDERLAERASRAVLSAVVEPGDGILGGLLLEHGAAELLDRLRSLRPSGADNRRHALASLRAGVREPGQPGTRGESALRSTMHLVGSGARSSGRQPRGVPCDSSSGGGFIDGGSSLGGARAADAYPDDGVLELFRSREGAGQRHPAGSRSPEHRGDGVTTPPGKPSLDRALARVSASIETWMLRLDHAEQALCLPAAAAVGARLLIPGDDDWPAGVDDLGRHAPIVLWVRGAARDLGDDRPAIALVGARACSAYGQQVASEASWHLARRGVTILSGGAYGIDGAVHRAAIRAGGRTVAFLAGGVDRLYPAGHHALLEAIIDNGALVSEVPCGTAPTKWRFLQRNRLIAAASQATVVIEAGARSGSLNTAGHAAQLGRPLGAVPGPVTTAHSIGCHRLLREYDAICVTSGNEMSQLIEFAPSAAETGAATASAETRAAPTAAESPGRPRESPEDEVILSTSDAPAFIVDASLQPRSPAPGATNAEPPLSKEPRTTRAETPSAADGGGTRQARPREEEPRARRLIDSLSPRTPRRPLELARASGLSLGEVVSELGSLQLRGVVRVTDGGWLYVPQEQRR